MSRVLERLLPTLQQHLDASDVPAASPATAPVRGLYESYQRWRHCFVTWRRILGNDVLLLVLLQHAGCLWSPQYARLHSAASAITTAPGDDFGDDLPPEALSAFRLRALRARCPQDLWALNVLHFLNLVELYELEDEAAVKAGSQTHTHHGCHGSSSSPSVGGERDASPARRLECSLSVLQDLLPPPFSRAATPGATGSPSPVVAAALQVASEGSQRSSHRTAAAAARKSHASACAVGIPAEEQLWLLRTALVSVTHADEPLVQQTASALVEEWLSLLSIGEGGEAESDPEVRGGALEALRDYWFAASIKFAAFVDGTHTALMEENAHVQAILARQSVPPDVTTEICHRSVPAILCCVLREEASEAAAAEAGGGVAWLQPRPLRLPPLVYLLPLHAVTRGSRVGVWVPSLVAAADAAPPTKRTRKDLSSIARTTGQGCFHLCRVESEGFFLRDETHALTLTVAAAGTEELEEEAAPHEVRNARRRRLSEAAAPSTVFRDREGSASTLEALLTSSSKGMQWSAQAAPLQGFLRLDLCVPRVLFLLPIPSRDVGRQGGSAGGPPPPPPPQPSNVGTGPSTAHGRDADNTNRAPRKRRGGAGGLSGGGEITLTLLSGVYPAPAAAVLATLQHRLPSTRITLSHQRGIGTSRLTTARDPLGSILQFLHLTARRLLALRATSTTPQVWPGAAAPAAPGVAQRPNGKGSGKGARPARGLVGPYFPSREAELHALVECAQTLTLALLALSHNLPDALREQQGVGLWLTEVASLAVDAALVTHIPVSRFLRAAGLALCLLPSRPAAALVAVGLCATLGARQLQSILAPAPRSVTKGNEDGSDPVACFWWSAFHAAVLADASLPAQLPPALWALAEDVDRSLRHALERRAHPAASTRGRPAGSTTPRALRLRVAPALSAPPSRRLALRTSPPTTEPLPELSTPAEEEERKQESPPPTVVCGAAVAHGSHKEATLDVVGGDRPGRLATAVSSLWLSLERSLRVFLALPAS